MADAATPFMFDRAAAIRTGAAVVGVLKVNVFVIGVVVTDIGAVVAVNVGEHTANVQPLVQVRGLQPGGTSGRRRPSRRRRSTSRR